MDSENAVSQCQVLGQPKYKTWADYRQGCLMSFHGGYDTQEQLGIFAHGMGTVFNLLEAQFPEPHEIARHRELLGEYQSFLKELVIGRKGYCGDHTIVTTQLGFERLQEMLKQVTAALEPNRSPESLAHEATADAIGEEK